MTNKDDELRTTDWMRERELPMQKKMPDNYCDSLSLHCDTVQLYYYE